MATRSIDHAFSSATRQIEIDASTPNKADTRLAGMSATLVRTLVSKAYESDHLTLQGLLYPPSL